MNMVEKVAKAIAMSCNGGDWNNKHHYSENQKIIYLIRAQAAIEAMREPSREMIRGLIKHRGYDPDAKEETLDKIGQLDISTIGVYTRSYIAMIDAALSDPEKSNDDDK